MNALLNAVVGGLFAAFLTWCFLTFSEETAVDLDLQDVLIALGFLALVGGVAAIYWPAGCILAGLMLFGFALLIERAKQADAKAQKEPR